MTGIRCRNCSTPYLIDKFDYKCPACGGIFDYEAALPFSLAGIEEKLPGIWRYAHSFRMFPDAPIVSLGEGNTPLVKDEYGSKEIYLKLEGSNPTGSHKDRGTAVLISQLIGQGAHEMIDDSSGNAGASFAAYAARAGKVAKVFVPDYASGPKCRQIEAYGAELIRISGPRSAASKALLAEVGQGSVYASHAHLPFVLSGLSTIAYELWEELGEVPGTVIVPVGHGSLLLGIVRGFKALVDCGLAQRLPYFIGVQAKACAPIWTGFYEGKEAMQNVQEGETLAEGVRLLSPVWGDTLLTEITKDAGCFVAVEEETIYPAWNEISRHGIYVELTSAIVWSALCEVYEKVSGPIVLIMTGSGLKNYIK